MEAHCNGKKYEIGNIRNVDQGKLGTTLGECLLNVRKAVLAEKGIIAEAVEN